MRKLLKFVKRKHSRDDRRSGRPSKPQFRPWLEALEGRIEPAPVWHNFPVPVPAGNQLSGGVTDITPGPDGAVWYTATWQNSASTYDFVGRLATDGSITQFPVQSTSILNNIITGPDGNLWFVAGNNTLDCMTPQGQVTSYQVPVQSALIGQFLDHGELTVGPDGNIWFPINVVLPNHIASNEPGSICRVTTSGQFTIFALPANTHIDNLVSGSDGNLWFLWQLGGEVGGPPPSAQGVGLITTAGAIELVTTLPQSTSFLFPQFSESALSAGPDGNVWFLSFNPLVSFGPPSTAVYQRWLNQVTPAGVLTSHALPLGQANSIMTGPDGNVWLFLGGYNVVSNDGMPGTISGLVSSVSTNGVVLANYPTPALNLGGIPIAAFSLPAIFGPDGNLYALGNVDQGADSITQLLLPVAGPVTKLDVALSSQNPTVTTPFSITVRAEDPTGTVDTAYQGTVHFSALGAWRGNLPGDYTFTAQDQGVHTFTGLVFNTAGPTSISVTDAATGVMGITQVTVSPGPAVAIALTGWASLDPPEKTGRAVIGSPLLVKVEALDAYGNAATSYTGPAHFTSSDPLAQLPADYTFTASDQGVHFFNVTFGTLGSEQVTVSDGVFSDSNTYVTQEPQQPQVPTWIHTYPFALALANARFYGNDGTAVGSDGAMWSPGAINSGLSLEQIARITTDGQYTILTPAGTEGLEASAIAAGPDGNLWIGNYYEYAAPYSNYITRLTPQGVATNFLVNGGGIENEVVRDIIAGPDGNMWFIDGANTIGRISMSGAITYLPVPLTSFSDPINRSEESYGILTQLAVGADGNIWFITASSYPGESDVGKMTLDGGVTLFPYFGGPLQNLVAGPDGNLWAFVATMPGNGHLVRISPDGTFSQYPVVFDPTGSTSPSIGGYPFGAKAVWLTAGPDGNLWMTVSLGGTGGGALIKITITGVETIYQLDDNLGSPGAGYGGLLTGPDGNLWANGFTWANPNTDFQPQAWLVQVVLPVAGPAAKLTVLTGSLSPTAGSPFAVTVRALDANSHVVVGYSGTVHFSTSAQLAGLPADYTFTSLDQGVHTFIGVNLDTAGAGSITVQDKTLGINGTTSVDVQPGPLAELIVRGGIGTALIGQPLQVTVAGADAFGNPVQSFTGTVHFTSSDAGAGLPPDYTFTASDNGSHTFSVTFNTAGAQSLNVSDNVDSLGSGSFTAVVIGSLKITAPASVQAGQLFSITVSAVDGSNNPVTAYRGAIHFSSTDQQEGLPADYQFTAADAGVHTFQGVFLGTSGTDQITVVDKGNASAMASARTSVSAGSLASLAISGSTSAIAGAPFSLTVAAYDRFHNAVTGYIGTVSITTNDPKGIVPGIYQFQASDHGVHTFTGIVLKTAGLETVTVTDSGAVVNNETSIQVTPAATSALQLASSSTVTAGTALGVTITLLDPYGNLAIGDRGTVHFGSSDSQAILPADYKFTAADAGVHTFTSIELDTAGTQTVQLTDTATSALTASVNVTVSPAAASREAINATTSVTAGTVIPLTVTLFDLYGNIALGYLGTVHFTSTDPQASLPADYTFQASDQGAHTFSNVLLKTAGSDSVTIGDSANSSLKTNASITVAPATASHYMINAPSHAQVGTATGITITAFDPYGNKATGYAGVIHFTSTDLHAGVPANYSFTSFDQGGHTFSVIFHAVGNQSLSVSDVNNSTLQATSQKTLVTANDWVTGADAGGGPEVELWDATTGKVKLAFMAYSPYFTGGVRVALGDIYNTGIPDIITVPGPTGGPDVRIFDGRTGQKVFEFMAFDPHFTGGLFVTVADFNGDGYADLAIGADAGGGPQVKIFSGKGVASGSLQVLASFYAYSPYFNGGVRLASGDINGDGTPDLITAPGAGGGPDVRVFDGAHLNQANPHSDIIREFMAYSPYFNGGVYLAAGDVNGDGKPDIITGAGAGGGPQVKVFSGVNLSLLETFMAYSPYFNGGVRVGYALDSDGHGDILTAAGSGGGPHVRVLDGMTLSQLDGFFAYNPAFNGGVFIGGE